MNNRVENLKKLIAERLNNLWFDDNCPELRAAIAKVLRDVVPDRSEIICDGSNNPPEVVKRNELVCSVYVPVKLTFTMKKRSVSVEEME